MLGTLFSHYQYQIPISFYRINVYIENDIPSTSTDSPTPQSKAPLKIGGRHAVFSGFVEKSRLHEAVRRRCENVRDPVAFARPRRKDFFMIKRTLSLALLLLGAQTAMAAAEINLGELVTATHDEEWQPVELEEDGVASMKPLLRAFTPKSEASFELLWKKEPKDGLEPYEAMVENCGDPIADASGKQAFIQKIGADFELKDYKTEKCAFGPLPCVKLSTTYQMKQTKTDIQFIEYTVFNKETGSVYLMRTAGNAAKAEGVFKGADILVQLVMKRDK